MTPATSSPNSRTWMILGGILMFVLLCIAVFVFAASQYRNALTAYGWVQNANDPSTDLDELLCENTPQARRFNTVFRQHYAGQDFHINLQDFEQDGNKVLFEGEIEVGDDTDDFSAIFIIGEDGSNGFLGLFSCIERIELLEPDTIPQYYWGG